jgi:hypothetical protein
MRRMRRWPNAVPMLVCGFVSACALNANPAEITVYHGQGNSQAVSFDVGAQGRQGTSQRALTLDLPRGTRVCMNVLNAHTPGFTYSLQDSLDATPPTPPSFGGLLNLLSAVIPTAGSTATSTSPFTALFRAASVTELTYPGRLDSLAQDLADAKKVIRESLLPETLLPAQFQVATGEERGLRYAQQRISGLPADSGRFNDPDLEATLNKWESAADSSPAESARSIIGALHEHARTLLAARNAIRDTYLKAGPSWRDCRSLANGITTLWLVAKPRVSDDFASQRDTGRIVQLTARTNFSRDALEIVPLAFVAFPHNVTGFSVVNDTVVENVKYADNASFRVGTMVTATPLRFGDSQEWAFGPGIGTGVIGDNKPALSDFFLGGLLSWRDWLRVGGGYGFAQAPGRLINGAATGKPLPLGNGRTALSDFIENKRVGTWFLSFTFTGLKLKVPGT